MAVVLIFSLGLVFAPAPTVAGLNGPVEVTIIECPCDPAIVPVSTNFGVKAEIYTPVDIPGDVTATIVPGANASVVLPPPAAINVGPMNAGDTFVVAWTLHCTAAGDTTVQVTTNNGGLDTCTVHQELPPNLVVTLSGPCEKCTNCDDNTFMLTATVTNSGDVGATDVQATISKTGGTTFATISGLLTKMVGTGYIGPGGGTGTVTWGVTCTGEGNVDFQVSVDGLDECTGLQIGGCPVTDTWTVYQRDVIVDVTCVIGLDSTGEPACGDTCPQEFDVVSVEQNFEVTAKVRNCTNQPMDLNVTPYDFSTHSLLVGTTAHVVCPGTGFEGDLTFIDGPGTIFLDDLCGCCYAYITWTFHCDSSTQNSSCVPIHVKAEKVGDTIVWDNEDCDTACIEQESKVHLTPSMAAKVLECAAPTWTEVDTVAVCQYFDVAIAIENKGEADALDVEVDLTVTGPTDCAGTWDDLVFGDIPGETTVTVRLSYLIGEPICHCTEEGMVQVGIDDIRGLDENTCEDIPGDNIDPVCPLNINQCPFEVEIINPSTCWDYSVGDVFAVKAVLRNCGMCDFYDIDVTLLWDGPGDIELLAGENALREMDEILGGACPEECCEYYVTWNVRCTGEGDVTFEVCVETNSDNDPVEDLDLQILSEPVTVHQWVPADLTVEILSPGGLDLEFQACGEGIAEWSTDEACTDSYSVKLYAPTGGDYGKLIFPLGMAFADLDDFSFYVEGGTTAQDLPLHEIELLGISANVTLNGDTVSATAGRINIAYQPGDAGKKTDAKCGWQLFGTHTSADIDASDNWWAVFWDSTGDGSFDKSSSYYTWAEIKAAFGAVATIKDFRVEMRYPPSAATVYVDDIIINGGTYEAEPVNTYIATSQDFALTALITNNGGVPITIGTAPVTCPFASVVSGPNPALPWMLDSNGGSVIATWTLHCDASGTCSINLAVSGTDTLGKFHTAADSVGIEQYPAAHLEVDITGYPTDPVTVSEEFPVTVTITNTGEADAWEVSAILSVFPEGSARVVAGDEGYTKFIGTLAGHDAPLEARQWTGTWMLHCKVACESTFTITAAGYDEYGWHLKQAWNEFEDAFVLSLESEPGRAIDERFIEPASVTVKQEEPSAELGYADLEVTKSVDPTGSVEVGQDVTFTITVENLGPADATSVWLWDLLPPGLNYAGGGPPSQGFYYIGQGFWSVGDLDEGVTATLTIVAKVNTVGEIHNLATVDFADQHDPITGNNADVVTITVPTPAPPEPVTEATISLDVGYNLISLPLIPEDMDIVAMMSGLDFIRVSQYVNDGDPSPDDWYYYNETPPSDLYTMEDGWGYWVNMNTPGVINFDGYELAPPPPAMPRAYDVLQKWNLVGFKSTVPKLPEVYFAGIAGQYTIIYGFDDTWFIVGTAGHEFLQSKLGYWIALKAGQSGTIFP